MGSDAYLGLLSVSPQRQGRGLGSVLLEAGLARCDAEVGLAYLESSNPRNVPLYERFGFVASSRFSVEGSPDSMTRERLECLKQVGVTRVSMGLQTLDPDELRARNPRAALVAPFVCVWDFFTEANFSGESMRLQAGNFPTLPQGWDKKIASFQCVQRSVASAQ